MCLLLCSVCVLCLILCVLCVSEDSSTLQIEGGGLLFLSFFKSGIFVLLKCPWLQEEIVSHFSHNAVAAFERLLFPQQYRFCSSVCNRCCFLF